MAENTTSSATDMGLISKLRDDDILLGRGQGASGYIGNRRMRRIVDTRREEYVTSDSHNVKKRISKEIYQQVRSKGGRFLCRVPPETLPESMRERTFYKEVLVAISLEKIKQSLREKQAPRKVKTDKPDANGDSSEKPVEDVQNQSGKLLERANEPPIITGSTSCILSSSERVQGVTKAPPSMNAASESVMSSVLQPPTSASGILPANLMQRTEPPLDASLLLFQSFALEQELMVNAVLQSSLKQMIGNRYLTHDLALQQDYQRYLNSWNPNLLCYPPANYAQLNTVSNDILGKATVAVQDTKQSSNEDSAGTDATKLQDSSTCEPDVDVSESILSAIGLGPDQPRFTELEAQLEQEELTDEEKHTILSDLFGDKCSLLSHPKKKPRREFDARTIAYLVRQMRSEIEQMSLTKKQALVEAQVKSRVEEFSDSRLERFLRCEGMNAKVRIEPTLVCHVFRRLACVSSSHAFFKQLAAERFVRYWEARRELFGPDKYYLRMALSEAVRDDLAALRAGLFCILPHPDLSGRHLLFLEPTKHTREGYTSQSMVSGSDEYSVCNLFKHLCELTIIIMNDSFVRFGTWWK